MELISLSTIQSFSNIRRFKISWTKLEFDICHWYVKQLEVMSSFMTILPVDVTSSFQSIVYGFERPWKSAKTLLLTVYILMRNRLHITIFPSRCTSVSTKEFGTPIAEHARTRARNGTCNGGIPQNWCPYSIYMIVAVLTTVRDLGSSMRINLDLL